MKGQLVIKFDVPNRGLVTNVPPHLVGPDALVDGNNVFVDLDGHLKTRLGPASVAGLIPDGERVIGLYSYEDNTGVFYPIAGTATRWDALISGTWTDISGGSFLTGNSNDQVRFTPFASSGVTWAIGANNNDVLHEWNSGLAAYQAIAASPIARDVVTLANRVVCFDTVEAGTRYPFRVRWSAFNDETTWPALALADLDDSGCSIVGVALTSRLSAVIYRQFAGWLIQAVAGGDATAFTFDRIPAGDHMTGPVGPGSIVIAEGSHYYFGVDGRIYRYNGLSIQPISDPIDPVIRGAYNTANPTRFTSSYVPAYRQLCFFFAQGNSPDPNACIVFDLRRGAFEPIWTFPFYITASSEMRISTSSVTWLNWVPALTDWTVIPYATWSSIPEGTERLTSFIGTDTGDVQEFMVSNTDNGLTIPYSATWGMQRSIDEMNSSLVHYFEVYQSQESVAEAVTAQILGYFQPASTGSQVVTVTSLSMNLADQTTFYQTTAPGPLNSQNLKSNLLQLILQSSGNLGQLDFIGATVFVDYEVRGDYTGLGAQ